MNALRLKIARWLIDERSWRIVPLYPVARQRAAGLAIVRRRALNAFAQDDIYVAMVKAA
jgi:hypothetical protein